MRISQKPSGRASPIRKQHVVIFFLATTLFVGAIIKTGMDCHWWLSDTEIVSTLTPEDIKVKLDVNNAPWYELVLLPKLGEVKARAIVAYREKYGSFKSIDELSKVKGINTSVLESIRDHIKIGADTASISLNNRE